MIKAKVSIKKQNFKDGFEKIVHSCCTEGVSGIKHLLIPRCLFNAESCVQKRPRRPTTSALAWVCQTLSLLRKKLSTPGPGGRLKTTSYAVVLLTISMEQLTWEWPGMQTLVSLIIVVCPICNVLYMLSTYQNNANVSLFLNDMVNLLLTLCQTVSTYYCLLLHVRMSLDNVNGPQHAVDCQAT